MVRRRDKPLVLCLTAVALLAARAAQAQTFSNSSVITINDGAPATPHPIVS